MRDTHVSLGADDFVLCSGTVRRLGVVDTARVAAATGYQGIPSTRTRCCRAADGWTLASLRALLDDLGLAVAEIDGAVDWVPGVSAGTRAATIDDVVAMAAGLRARSITAVEVSGRRLGPDLPFEDVVDGFARFCDAAQHDVLVHVEYFPRASRISRLRWPSCAADKANGACSSTPGTTPWPDAGAAPLEAAGATSSASS
jgi:sugar phosphate isomerase/epimerase